MKKVNILSIIFLFFVTFFSFSQNSELILLKPDSSEDLKKGQSEIVLRANQKKCRIFINGEFLGNTPLTVKNLPEGLYNLKIVAENGALNFEKSYEVQVKDAFRQEFYIEFENLPTEKSKGYRAGPLAR